MLSNVHHNQSVQRYSRPQPQHASIETTNEKLNSFKEKLLQSLSSSSEKIKPSDLGKHISELVDNNEKILFLRVALQTGVDVNGQVAPNKNLGKHMQLVSWAIKQIATLGSSVEVSNSISKIDLSKASDQMIEHLNFARRLIELYPGSEKVSAFESQKKIFNFFRKKEKSQVTSKLQNVLNNVFDNPKSRTISKANRLLISSQSRILRQSESIQSRFFSGIAGFKSDPVKAWLVADEKGDLDLQRAILLLRPASLAELRADSRKKIADPAIKSVLKELPYYARQGLEGGQGNFNAEASFQNQKRKKIVCRHLATHRIETQAMSETGKFRVDGNKPIFTDLMAVQRNVQADIEQRFDRLGANADKNYLINNVDLGKTLVKLFKEMDEKIASLKGDESKEKMQSVQYIALCSENHVMSLKLHVKTMIKSENINKYVVEFYDPNLTNNHVRLARIQLNTLSNLKLKDLFLGASAKLYSSYFPRNNETSFLFVTGTAENTKKILNGELDPKTSKNRKLDNELPVESISPHIISHLLREGFAENLLELAPKIKSTKSEDELIGLLEAKDDRGTPGLHLALIHGHADAIKALGPLMPGVPKEKRVNLLEAKSADGVTGLYFALALGNAKAVEAYGSLLAGLSSEDRIRLLQAKGIDDFPGLNTALLLGKADSIGAYGTLLKNLPENDRLQLLEAKSPNGIPGVYDALSGGHADAIKAFGNLIQDFSVESRSKLFESFNSDVQRSKALARGHVQAVEAYDQLLSQLR